MIPLLADPAPGLLRAAPIDPSGHTMSRESLLRYLEIKVHHLIQDHGCDSIRVIGGYDRTTIVSRYEKGGKLFNTERPTAEVHGHDLVVKAFPGADYVQHYALIIASYLAMTGRPAARPTGSRSAVWKTDTATVFAAVAHILRPGGRFVFNIGGGFAGVRHPAEQT
ncbi:hypothetical protein ACFY20_06370 [Streptomyces sp. NPDC001312]|uniref:hypothetical protein n=1 Tax=Streptomyces sp. NPDC001312 TaxID=3364561 RepID=UPI0036C819A1